MKRRPILSIVAAAACLVGSAVSPLVLLGCGGPDTAQRSGAAGPEYFTERGAEGDREVADGPGLFTGAEGGVVFGLPSALRREEPETDEGAEDPRAPE